MTTMPPKPRLPKPTIVIVRGAPAGQGRLSFNRYGQGYYSNGKLLKPWKQAIVDAALDRFPQPLEGPVELEATVTVPKPASAPKTLTVWPVTRSSGDWDHHARAISDALTGIAYHDDSQVVAGAVTKVYPSEGVDALDQPGAVIRVRQLPAAVLA